MKPEDACRLTFVFLILFSILTSTASYAADGDMKWAFPTGSVVYPSPAVCSDGTIYVGSHDCNLYAINSNGTEKWRFPIGSYVWSSPAIGPDGTIYVGSYDYSLYAINPDGTQKWAFPTGNEVRSSPAIGSDRTIYVGSNDYYLYAINPDGTQKWAFPTGNYVTSSPAIGLDGTIYVGSHDHNLYAINPDGTEKWRFPTGSYVWSSPAIGSDGTIYVGSYDNSLYAISPDGTQKWAFPTGNIVHSSPAIGSDGAIYVGSNDYNLYAINPDGIEKSRFPTGRDVSSSPAIGSDGTIYVGSGNNLYAINPDGTEKWKFPTVERVYSSPAIGSDGTIYVGSHDGNLYAIEGSSGGLADSPWPMFHHDLKHTGRVTIPDTGCIEGHVNDMDSNPIRWALVIARKEPVREIALTDVTGFYEIMDLEPGEYVVLAYKKGYKLGFARITVLPGDCSYLGFQLKPKAAEDDEDEIPDLANFPNPFNPDTWIPYLVTDDADVTVSIRDAAGRHIRTLALGRRPAGLYMSKDRAAYWDGRNEAGEEVASGIYFYTIHAGDFTATKKMIVRR